MLGLCFVFITNTKERKVTSTKRKQTDVHTLRKEQEKKEIFFHSPFFNVSILCIDQEREQKRERKMNKDTRMDRTID